MRIIFKWFLECNIPDITKLDWNVADPTVILRGSVQRVNHERVIGRSGFWHNAHEIKDKIKRADKLMNRETHDQNAKLEEKIIK